MTIREASVCLTLAVFCGTSVGLAEGQQAKYTGTFSSLAYHQEAGDLLGVEIKIVATRKGFQGALQIAEGGPSPLIIVDVSFEKGKVMFKIPESSPEYAGGVFEGYIGPKGIIGTFTFKAVRGDKENLIRGRSYWDK